MRHATRQIIVAAAVLGLAAVATGRAHADNITYTWHEDDTQSVVGSFVVKGSAQAAGTINLPGDEVSFDFVTPNATISSGALAGGFSIPISTSDASPTAVPGTEEGGSLFGISPSLNFSFAFDTNWDVVKGEPWSVVASGSSLTGVGHWTITGATTAVPEPSSLALAALTAAGLACRRRPRRP